MHIERDRDPIRMYERRQSIASAPRLVSAGLTPAAVMVILAASLAGCSREHHDEAVAPSATLQDEDEGTDDQAPDGDESPTPSDGARGGGGCTLPRGKRGFDELKGPADALDQACVPEIDHARLNEAFMRLRDTRLGPDEAPDDPATLVDEHGLARRLPWLLADNGCEERAPAAAYLMNAWGYPTPYYARAKAKHGKSLHIDTRNVPGLVVWSSHVAPVLRSEGTLYVLDPAVEAQHPLTVSEWLTRITYRGAVTDLEAAVCRDEPAGDGCFTEVPRGTYFPQGELLEDRLPSEWRLQQVLGRIPEDALGDCPPWRACGNELPARPSADRPPVLKEVINLDYGTKLVATPLAFVGDNFVEGFTRVELAADDFEGPVVVDSFAPRLLTVDGPLPPGHYWATVFNGDLASDVLEFDLK